MTFHRPITAAAPATTGFERTEALMGRRGWTFDDYVAEGLRIFDNEQRDRFEPLKPSARAEFAKGYAQLACPPAKLRAHVAARNEGFVS